MAVLVAISIPIFTSQLEKAREATDEANLRAAYAEVSTAVLTGEASKNTTNTITKDDATGSYSENVGLQQQKAGWIGDTPKIGSATIEGAPKDGAGHTATVTADKDGKVTIKFI